MWHHVTWQELCMGTSQASHEHSSDSHGHHRWPKSLLHPVAWPILSCAKSSGFLCRCVDTKQILRSWAWERQEKVLQKESYLIVSKFKNRWEPSLSQLDVKWHRLWALGACNLCLRKSVCPLIDELNGLTKSEQLWTSQLFEAISLWLYDVSYFKSWGLKPDWKNSRSSGMGQSMFTRSLKNSFLE